MFWFLLIGMSFSDQVPSPRPCCVCGLPRRDFTEADLWYLQQGYASPCTQSETICWPTDQCYGGVLHLVPGWLEFKCLSCCLVLLKCLHCTRISPKVLQYFEENLRTVNQQYVALETKREKHNQHIVTSVRSGHWHERRKEKFNKEKMPVKCAWGHPKRDILMWWGQPG